MEYSRCHLPSGKVVWLCPDHQKADRVTVLATGDVVEGEFAEDDDFFISQIVEETQFDRPSMLLIIAATLSNVNVNHIGIRVFFFYYIELMWKVLINHKE